MQNPLTAKAFLAWVEKQPANGEYDYSDHRNCAFCQYLRAVGLENPSVNPIAWRPDRNALDYRPLPSNLDEAAADRPWTFGALADRLRSSQVQP